MNLFEVKGEVEYEYNCECEHCPGHEETFIFTGRVEAGDAADAEEKIKPHVTWKVMNLVQAATADEVEWKWYTDPTVTRLSEDVLMRRAGYAELPGLQSVP